MTIRSRIFHWIVEGPRLDDSHRNGLSRPVSDEEIWEAISSLPSKKAPGIDGFSASFYRAYWDIMKFQVIAVVRDFFVSGHMPASWKRTLICLIPKSSSAARGKDFRPISLCTFPYKICTKILANRLKQVLPCIVGREQGAFIAGRNISDNILVATELFHSVIVARGPRASPDRFMLKLDMEKAFDRISHRFILQALSYFGFPDVWREWIRGVISMPLFAVQVNGDRSPWFDGNSGIRQGCPLSPFLFVLGAEILSRFFRFGTDRGAPLGISLSPSLPKTTHLFFADDVARVASRGNCSIIIDILTHYCRLSGQSMNPTKSRLVFSPKMDVALRLSIHNIFGVESGSEILFYLGIPFSGHAPKE